MASSFTRASPYLQQTAKKLASREVKAFTYPLWAYVVGCVGVAVICLFDGWVTALLQKRGLRNPAEKGDLEVGVLTRVPTDGTFPDYMAKGPHINEVSSYLESERKVSLPTKMKRVFHKFGRKHHDAASITVVDTTSATNTIARTSVGSQARGDWKRDFKTPEAFSAHELQLVGTFSRSEVSGHQDAITRLEKTKIEEDRIELAERK